MTGSRKFFAKVQFLLEKEKEIMKKESRRILSS
jgi:hypothetical protein